MVDAILSHTKDPKEDFYSLLGCSETSTAEQLNTEFKKRALSLHPDKNINNTEDTSEEFQLLQRAKEVLLDEEKRADYDKWRNIGLAVSYKEWLSMKDSVKSSMHWATKRQHDPMIEPVTAPTTVKLSKTTHKDCHIIGNVVWERQKGNELLQRFRNYQI